MATYRYGVVRSRIAASQLVAGAGVSGSSPLVGSLFFPVFDRTSTQIVLTLTLVAVQ